MQNKVEASFNSYIERFVLFLNKLAYYASFNTWCWCGIPFNSFVPLLLVCMITKAVFEIPATIKTKSTLRKLFRNHLSNEDNLYINWRDLTQSIQCLFRMKGVLERNLIIHYLSSFFASNVKLPFRS